jgi:hypothetical protein
MIRHSVTIFSILFICLCANTVSAQGLRSSGIGFRVSYWNMHDAEGGFRVSTGGLNQSVNIEGFGFWLNFYSRVHNRWFMELNLGFVGRIDVEQKLLDKENVDVEGVIPFLFGIRYDLLTNRSPSRFHPYLSLGGGSYWRSSTSVRVDEVTGQEYVSAQGDANLGAYLGGGFNLPISSWLGLNFDLKYHLVELKVAKGISGPEFSIGLNFMWGKKKEIFRVKETRVIVRDIYPTYYQFYNTYPLALVTVQNTAGFPIEVNVSSRVIPYSIRPKKSETLTLERGEVKDIPVTAIFSPSISDISSREPAVLEIRIEGQGGSTLSKEVNEQLTIHSRNAWNGEIDKLGFFVTPDDEEILLLSRRLAKTVRDSINPGTGNLTIAEEIFNELQRRGINYQSDPNIPFYRDDRVQFAGETLKLGSGDCDDLVVVYASLLESLGIKTAFVQVQDPEKPLAHLYLLFDSGLAAEEAHFISSNEKRYIIRENSELESSIYGGSVKPEFFQSANSAWIPVETTLVNRGFEDAWKSGAVQYLQEARVRNGLAEGWVKIIDVN